MPAFEQILKMNLRAEIIAFLRAHPNDVESALKLGVKSCIIEHCVNPYFVRHIYNLDHKATVDRITGALKIAKDQA